MEDVKERRNKAHKLLEQAQLEGSIKLEDLDKAFDSSDRIRRELVKTLEKHNIPIIGSEYSIDEQPIIDTSLDSDVIAEEIKPVKRGRGRPRKNPDLPPVKKEKPVKEVKVDDDFDDEEDDDLDSYKPFDEEDDEKENLEESFDEEEELPDLSDDEDDDSSFYDLSEDDLSYQYDNFDDILSSRASQSNQRIQVDNSVRMYLKEIGRINLLTVEEERQIAKTIYDAKVYEEEFNKKVEEGHVPTNQEIEDLNRIREEGDQAKRLLTEANLRLVIHIAKNFNASNMDFADLIQEGSHGLMKAVEKFDYTRGNKFSTYATGWIKQAITRAIADQARTIRIPVHMNETINRLNKKERELTQNLGRKPTIEELADAMALPPSKITMIKRVSQKTKSLEDPVGEEEDSTYGDFIPDTDNPNPEEYTMNEALKNELDSLLSNLSDREERVIKLRFGLIDGRTRTLEEVGKEFVVTRERIRQIEAKALRKLRQPSRQKKLRDFLKE